MIGFAVIGLLTVAAASLPALLPDPNGYRFDVSLLMPSFLVGVLGISTVSAVATGGGRELLPRDQAVAFPVSPATDHLGALLMAPLNIAWLLQSWALLGAFAYSSPIFRGVEGVDWKLLPAQGLILLWILFATALAQVLAWAVEWLRRGPHGTLLVRGIGVLVFLAGVVLVRTNTLTRVLDYSPTKTLTLAAYQALTGDLATWALTFVVLAVVSVAVIVLGAVMAAAVARRPARDEVRLETSSHPARSNPVSNLVAVLRVDRASVWRSLPLRRGLGVLAVMPGLVALAGSLQWQELPLLPGLVASGGALLFGVNAWSLDAHGALWRDSVPAAPRLMFLVRAIVVAEILMLAITVTLVLAAVRAGAPTAAALTALVCATVVVLFQVVSASMRWSVRRPYTVDLRSARATPAPPLVMVGYSARLALSTTLTGMVFVVAALMDWSIAVALTLPFLLTSGYRLLRVAREWDVPEIRSKVIATIAS
jgi:hypothetical protein